MAPPLAYSHAVRCNSLLRLQAQNLAGEKWNGSFNEAQAQPNAVDLTAFRMRLEQRIQHKGQSSTVECTDECGGNEMQRIITEKIDRRTQKSLFPLAQSAFLRRASRAIHSNQSLKNI